MIDFERHPDGYRHWHLSLDGAIATLEMKVDPDGGLAPGYTLKLNSYDLGVDIELADAVQRLRFEHPEVHTVVLTSALDKVFCAGANISMLAQAAHHHKVNFCKFTNETRNGIGSRLGRRGAGLPRRARALLSRCAHRVGGNLRFVGPETMETKIFARLSAWQNWIFNRPNASGAEGALRRYGTGARPEYDRTRV